MEGVVTLTVDEYLLLGVALAIFAVLGFRRGVKRELLSMIGIALAMLFAASIASGVAPLVNQLYRLVRMALGGGLTGDDPTAAWRRARELPDLVSTAADGQFMVVVVFALIMLFFYLWGQDRVEAPRSIMPKILGLLAGGINGFLIAYHLFPLLFPQPRAVIAVPSRELNATLANSQTLAWVIVFFVIVLIAFGLYSASGPRERR